MKMKLIHLKDICDLDNGYAFKSNDYVENSNTLNCRMSNIRPDGSFDIMYNAKYLPDEYADEYSDYILKDGDLIIAMTDMAGDPKILGVPTVVETKGYNLLLNQRVGKLRFIKEGVNADYLKLALQSKQVRSYLKRFAGGGVQLNVSKKNILNSPIQMRTEDQQEYIVNVFTKIKNTINYRKHELELLNNLIKARFVELFGLPVSNTKGWKTEQMNDVAPTVNYTGDFDDEVWLLNLDMVESQTGRILDYLIVSEEEVGNSTCTFDTSNVLYSKLRPYLNKVVIPNRCGYATSELVPLQPVASKINREYLAFLLRSDEFVNMINEKVAGAKMPRVSMSDFRKFDVPIPTMELQKEFAEFVAQVDKSKVAVQKALDEAQLLFDSLMQKYFG